MEKRAKSRRTEVTDYNRRKFDRRNKLFYYKRNIHLGDTQMMGGTVYYAQYWDFVGEAREEYLKFTLGDNFGAFFTSGVLLVTVDVAGSYKEPLFAYDQTTIFVETIELTKASFRIRITIKNQHDRVNFLATMKIGCVKNGKVIAVPAMLKDPLEKLKKE